jgi:GTPase involved in cell partitioning and DNA repair
LRAFSETLTEKPVMVVATKLDATTDRTRLDALREFCGEQKLEFHAISAATGEGVRELVRSIADALDKIPKPAPDALLELAHDSHEHAVAGLSDKGGAEATAVDTSPAPIKDL